MFTPGKTCHSWAKVRTRFSEWAKYLRKKKIVPGETSFRRKVVEYCCVRASVFAISPFVNMSEKFGTVIHTFPFRVATIYRSGKIVSSSPSSSKKITVDTRVLTVATK